MWFVRNALAAFYPREGNIPGVAECGLAAFLSRFRRETSRLMWVGVLLSTLVFQLSSLFTVGIPLPAFMLSERLRDRHASKLSESRFYLIRQSTFILKFVAGLCWGSDARVRASMALKAYPQDPGTWRQA